ncbi:MAG TPA: hypothetical protein PLZ56_08535 [Anaerolineae bacterium]|nr:hypothetical protein [Ardenticatenia bacterium]HRA20479.1 hypothetical protein [Anaerolineae bacterium]
MQLISALFDAPVPAGMALTALAQEGAAPADLGVWPPLPAIPVPPPAALLLAEAADLAGALRLLAQLGLPAEGLAQAQEGLARGAILVMARAPDLSAAALVKRLSECSPLGPEAALAWARDGALRYRWSELGQG